MLIYLDLMPRWIVKIGNVVRCGKVEMGTDVFSGTRVTCYTDSVK